MRILIAVLIWAAILFVSTACGADKATMPVASTPEPIRVATQTRAPTALPARPPTSVPALGPVGACPQGCVQPPGGCRIKGNISVPAGEKIYHVPGGSFYEATVISPAQGERWFCTEQEALNNGWRPSRGG